MNWKRWVIVAIVGGVVAVVGGPWVYINLIRAEAPAPLTSATDEPASGDANTTLETTDGTWNVAAGSVVGYRVGEILFGQSATAVGRTEEVTGSMQVGGTTIDSAAFTVDMTSVESDESRRDNQFHGRIMDTTTHPTSTFELTEPLTFEDVPSEGTEVSKTAAGNLTLRGTTKPVEFNVTGELVGDVIQIKGSIPIVFAEWNIPNPSGGPARTEDNGILEFAINFEHQ